MAQSIQHDSPTLIDRISAAGDANIHRQAVDQHAPIQYSLSDWSKKSVRSAGEVGDQSVVLVAHDITRFSQMSIARTRPAFTPIQNPSPIAAAIVIASPCPRREPLPN